MSGAAKNEDLKATKLFDVSHYTAVVTGGGTGMPLLISSANLGSMLTETGIGLMITQALVANGAKVYITGRREEALKTVVEKYSTGPGKIVA
jgi:NAD(P)-dependent dehydrogenase (short-subunit alcohol dehydrogenase family)